jgi:peptide/nickel transport system substrate-binding protein
VRGLCSAFNGIAVLVATSLILLVSPSSAEQKPASGGTLTVGVEGDPSTVNPALSSGIAETMAGCGIYEGLVQPTATFQFRPALAKSWTISDDGLAYTFALRQANWQDGKPFTAADVAYSLVEFNGKYSPMFGAPGKLIDHIDTPAADRVVIHLT